MSLKVSEEQREDLRAGRLTCHYCPERAESWDHVVPRCLGGSDHLGNLVPSCVACNHAKAGALPSCRCEECRLSVVQWRRGLGRVRRRVLLDRLAAAAVANAARLAAVEAALSESAVDG